MWDLTDTRLGFWDILSHKMCYRDDTEAQTCKDKLCLVHLRRAVSSFVQMRHTFRCEELYELLAVMSCFTICSRRRSRETINRVYNVPAILSIQDPAFPLSNAGSSATTHYSLRNWNSTPSIAAQSGAKHKRDDGPGNWKQRWLVIASARFATLLNVEHQSCLRVCGFIFTAVYQCWGRVCVFLCRHVV